jgi:hypothetical protein
LVPPETAVHRERPGKSEYIQEKRVESCIVTKLPPLSFVSDERLKDIEKYRETK